MTSDEALAHISAKEATEKAVKIQKEKQEAEKTERRVKRLAKKRALEEVEEKKAVLCTQRLNAVRAQGRRLKKRQKVARERTLQQRQAAAARALAELGKQN